MLSVVLHPLTSFSSSQVAVVKSQDFDMSQKMQIHRIRDVEERVPCAFLLWMSLHVHEPPAHYDTAHTPSSSVSAFPAITPRNEGSLLQPELSIQPINRWSLSPSVLFLCLCC